MWILVAGLFRNCSHSRKKCFNFEWVEKILILGNDVAVQRVLWALKGRNMYSNLEGALNQAGSSTYSFQILYMNILMTWEGNLLLHNLKLKEENTLPWYSSFTRNLRRQFLLLYHHYCIPNQDYVKLEKEYHKITI